LEAIFQPKTKSIITKGINIINIHIQKILTKFTIISTTNGKKNINANIALSATSVAKSEKSYFSKSAFDQFKTPKTEYHI